MEGERAPEVPHERDGRARRDRRLSRALLVVFAGLLTVIVYVLSITPTGDYRGDRQALPDFDLKVIPEGHFGPESLVGRITVLNFFATWCGPCQAEMPELVRFAAAQDKSEVAVVGVSAGYDTRPDLLPFLERFGVTFTVVHGGEALLNDLGLSSLPTTVLVDPEGRVAVAFEGAITRAQLQAAVDRVRASLPLD